MMKFINELYDMDRAIEELGEDILRLSLERNLLKDRAAALRQRLSKNDERLQKRETKNNRMSMKPKVIPRGTQTTASPPRRPAFDFGADNLDVRD